MAPKTFIQRPLLWLETISATRATTAISPNFGFDYCLRRIPEEQAAALDLSSWRLALNGAEPVRADTMDAFAERFARSGFDRRALLPCYGLAEATLLVSGAAASRPPRIGTLDAAALENGRAEAARAGDRSVRSVGCGPAADRVGVAIVDPATRRRLPAYGSARSGCADRASPAGTGATPTPPARRSRPGSRTRTAPAPAHRRPRLRVGRRTPPRRY